MSLILVTPRMSEKAYALVNANNVYIFDTPLHANKQQITAAIEAQYEVTVTGIKTLVQSGKAVRASKGKNRSPGVAHRKDAKKAYVTLKEGDKIQVFEEPAAEETK